MKEANNYVVSVARASSRREKDIPSGISSQRTAEYGLQSLTNGFEVLALLSRESDLTLTDISNRLQMNKTVAYRLLNTLQQNKLIERNTVDKRYRLGLSLWELGAAALRDMKVRDLALHHLPLLARQTGESVNLSVYDDGDALFLELIRHAPSGTVQAPIALRCPAHCSAAGKAMLAYHTEAEIERYCDRAFVAATPHTIVTPERLRSEVAQIRSQGFAVNRGEWFPESCGVAVPLLDHIGHAVAAIGIACPASRFSDTFVARVAEPALACAREISRALGFKEASAPWHALS